MSLSVVKVDWGKGFDSWKQNATAEMCDFRRLRLIEKSAHLLPSARLPLDIFLLNLLLVISLLPETVNCHKIALF
jgi:hypothetical protein